MLRLLATVSVALVPGAAFAHTGFGNAAGFAHGFAHPIGGLDHLAVMVAVGLVAAQIGGRALWLLPATFVGVMALGGALGTAGIAVPFVETGIGISVLALGLAVAFGLDLPVLAAAALIGLFAIFHGHAHGAEMPETASGLAYGLGFLLATALLHGAGIGLGLGLGREAAGRFRAAPLLGGAMSLAGILILAGQV